MLRAPAAASSRSPKAEVVTTWSKPATTRRVHCPTARCSILGRALAPPCGARPSRRGARGRTGPRARRGRAPTAPAAASVALSDTSTESGSSACQDAQHPPGTQDHAIAAGDRDAGHRDDRAVLALRDRLGARRGRSGTCRGRPRRSPGRACRRPCAGRRIARWYMLASWTILTERPPWAASPFPARGRFPRPGRRDRAAPHRSSHARRTTAHARSRRAWCPAARDGAGRPGAGRAAADGPGG